MPKWMAPTDPSHRIGKHTCLKEVLMVEEESVDGEFKNVEIKEVLPTFIEVRITSEFL